MFIMTNMCLWWQNTSFVMTKVCLSWQNFCPDKHIFIMTKLVTEWSVATKIILLWQNFCHDKLTFVMTKCLLQHLSLLGMRKLLSPQILVATVVTNIISSCDKHYFVATSILLSQQKTCFVTTNTCLSWQNFCCDKNDTCGSSRQRYLTLFTDMLC